MTPVESRAPPKTALRRRPRRFALPRRFTAAGPPLPDQRPPPCRPPGPPPATWAAGAGGGRGRCHEVRLRAGRRRERALLPFSSLPFPSRRRAAQRGLLAGGSGARRVRAGGVAAVAAPPLLSSPLPCRPARPAARGSGAARRGLRSGAV